MKKLILLSVFLLSCGAFAQNTHPVIPGPYEVANYEAELYACNPNGDIVKNPYSMFYKKYKVFVTYAIIPGQHIEPLHITLQDRLCETGEVIEGQGVVILSIEGPRQIPRY